jgi:toxin-antitoxin system PIN domain toxin
MPDDKAGPAGRIAPTVFLLDVNVLLALTWPQHVHSALAHKWFGEPGGRRWATCAITQLGFVRLSSNRQFVADAVSPGQALELLRLAIQVPGHVYWPERQAPTECPLLALPGLVGHRQVTDGYLLSLAVAHGGKLVTLDRGIAAFAKANRLADVVELIGAAGA